MASADDLRITAMLLKKNLSELYTQVMPLYALAYEWLTNATDAELPPEKEVKAVLDRYNAMKIPRNSSETSIREVQQVPDTFTGPWPTYPPECGEMTTGLFDGSALFDGSQTFDGGA